MALEFGIVIFLTHYDRYKMLYMAQCNCLLSVVNGFILI